MRVALLIALLLGAPAVADESVTIEEEIDLGALEESAGPLERERERVLLLLPLLAVGLLIWNTRLRGAAR